MNLRFACAWLLLPFCVLLNVPLLVAQTAANNFQPQLDYLNKYAEAPDQYVIDKFRNYDVILLGEAHAIHDNLVFVASLIPELYQAGVYNIGMEFGASEDQQLLDSLVNAPVYNEQLARDLMFNYNVGWAYKEYSDIYRATWNFNQTLSPKARKFRILSLSYKYDWSQFKSPRTPESMSKVFMKGTVDKFRADLVEREIIAKKENILILTGTPHAYTRYKSASYEYNADNFCHYDDDWFGNRLYNDYPKKVFSILLHQPFFNLQNKKPTLLSPANSEIELLMASMNNKPLGFDLVNSPMGALPDSSSYSFCYTHFTMGQFFDGYIFLKPFSQMTGCTIDTLFFEGKSWDTIQKQYPDPDWRGKPKTLDEYKAQIKSFADLSARFKGLPGF